ncbi:MAG TPA: SUKH-3 domain-containing protein [Streptosporangiaceae bacterium]|nr:SUKH-3 domain-containing protein [Streptosporangiaceae bacterium]
MRDKVGGVLRKAGWLPGRSQDIATVRSVLKSRGYSIGDAVARFLREFTGITINFIRNGRPDSIWFDAQRASALADPEWVVHYGERTKTSLVPIGFSNHEHLLLMQSDEGGFYGAFDDYLCALGSEVDEMIDNLLNQDREPLV